MLKYVYIHNVKIPMYGLMVLLGIDVSICIALRIANKNQQISQMLFLMSFGGFGAVFGAKILTLVLYSMREKEIYLSWNYFIKAGYSYYGGLFGFVIFDKLICKIKKIDYKIYEENYIFLLPLLHFFGKLDVLWVDVVLEFHIKE